MSVGCSEATIVKEEYEILEYDFDFKEALDTEGTFDEHKLKCGEVFLGHRGGGFIFVCAQCQQTFNEFHSFGEHIRDEHPLFDVETILPISIDGDMTLPKLESSEQHASDFGIHGGEPSDEIAKMEVDASVYNAHCKDDDHSEVSKSGTSKENCISFSCKSCDSTFFEFESYRRHYTSEHSDMIEIDDDLGNSSEQTSVPSEMCKYCSNTFDDEATYHSHMENVHPSKLYSCPYCPKSFTQKHQRNNHVDTHEGRKTHKCPHCPSAFSRRNNMNDHVRCVHTAISLQFTCRFCEKQFKRKSDMKRHEQQHTAERTVECNECDMKFRNKRQLHNHMLKHDMRQKNYKCTHCDKAFLSSTHLEEHLLMLSDEQIWMCKYCSKSFDCESSYNSHVENDHPNRLYSCPYCPKSFTQRVQRNYHVDNHEGRKPHKCPHCPSAFSRRNNLNDHVRFVHTTISLQFTCRLCGNKFKRKSDLKRHEQLHTMEGTVGCYECDLKFRNKRQLYNHMLKHNLTQKNYKCTHCDKAFICSTLLEEHLLTHRDERPLNANIGEHIKTKEKSRLQSIPEDFPSPKSEPDGEEVDS